MEKGIEIVILIILVAGILLGRGDADFNIGDTASAGFFTSNQAYFAPQENVDFENSYAVDKYSDPNTGYEFYKEDEEIYVNYDDLDMGYEFYLSDLQ